MGENFFLNSQCPLYICIYANLLSLNTITISSITIVVIVDCYVRILTHFLPFPNFPYANL